jgi:hypothetical protein
MKIELKEILIKDLTKGFQDNDEDGVVGYNKKLDIRPPYQREFIYKDKQRDAVIDTVQKKFPLNIIYWAVREDGNFEVIDGQQRIISICQYVNGDYSINGLAFHNLTKDKQDNILNYPLSVYFCSGSDSEKLEWFETINIAGEKLTNQELRNAVYSGPWVTDAKRYFSKRNCAAYNMASDYLDGTPIRQDYLETAIEWISNNKIREYMSEHQHKKDASELWGYFNDVIVWLENNFKIKRIMKGVDWGKLYNNFKDKVFDKNKINKKAEELIIDDEVTKKSGIYPYLITSEEKYLSLRAFPESIKLKIHQKQNGKCKVCNEKFEISEMQADHIKAWSEGGKTTEENCQMLCIKDHKLMKNK